MRHAVLREGAQDGFESGGVPMQLHVRVVLPGQLRAVQLDCDAKRVQLKLKCCFLKRRILILN